MILTTHILSGAALGANVNNPYAVAGLSIVLHFLLDLFPHGDYLNKKSRLREFWKVALDIIIGLSIVAAIIFIRGLAPNNALNIENILIGILFSLLPDFTTFLHDWMKMKLLKPIYFFHQKLHLLHHPDFAPERKFRLKNNLWDVFISFVSLLILILA